MGIAINEKLCKGCMICVTICPQKVYSVKEIAKEGRKMPFPAQADKCIYCKKCELFCPDFAITLKQEHEKQKKRK